MTLTRTASSLREEEEEPPKPGFLPGITHFTDAINALPKEVQRHSTMLKEVDAKIYAIENDLRAIAHTEPPICAALSLALGKDDAAQRYYEHAVHVMGSMLVSLDEKNIVLSTANEALDKLLARCDSAWPLIEQEISQETRWGRSDHWAYTDKSADKKPTANTERASRRNNDHDRNIAAVVTDVVNSKSSKNQKRLNQETIDAENGLRKAGSHKRKPNDNFAGLTGLGLSNVTMKKQKVEKPLGLSTNGGHIMEKSISSVFRNMPGSPITSGVDVKKRVRSVNGAVNGRKRAGTAVSNTGSPMMASSPIISSYALPGKGGISSAAGTPMVRTTSSRRGGPTSNPIQSTRPASAASTPLLNGHSYPDEKPPISRMSSGYRGDDLGNGDGENRSNSRSGTKREDIHGRPRPPSISTATRNNGKASKTSTPVIGTFPDTSRPRSGRNSTTTLNATDLLPPKRSHKKKAPAALQRQRSKQTSGRAGDEDDSDAADDMEGPEQLYCYCNGPSHGEMVACDMPGCEKEWFHLECVGLSKLPSTKSKLSLPFHAFSDTCTNKKLQRSGSARRVNSKELALSGLRWGNRWSVTMNELLFVTQGIEIILAALHLA